METGRIERVGRTELPPKYFATIEYLQHKQLTPLGLGCKPDFYGVIRLSPAGDIIRIVHLVLEDDEKGTATQDHGLSLQVHNWIEERERKA